MSNDNKKNAQQPIVLFKCPKVTSDAKVSVQPGTPTWEVGIPRSPIKYEKKIDKENGYWLKLMTSHYDFRRF